MGWPRKSLYLSVAYVIAFALAFSVPSFIHRRAFDQPFSAWYKNPTPENASALRAQEHENEQIHAETSAIAAFVLLAAVCGVYSGLRMGKRYFVSASRSQTQR